MVGNYIPLYRKYRPQTLANLVGQEHIKKTLTSAIQLGKISHAYLFTGPRGTGKTSTARILAKSLNCVNGPTENPCGECESCKNITNSIPIDVIEIDAASNRKVEDAQNLLEKIQYAPVNGKYKIYIIDEVHMLSSTAFNALLKTLEEPPQNVIFILATTEVHKVLDTIKSRCQRFDFKRITTDDIVKHLKYISEQENINITEDALYTIAKNSAGGMRDSISLLDQLSILGISKQITTDDVNSILGRISFDVLHKLSDAIITSQINASLGVVNDIYNSGNEPLQILTNLAEYFKNLLMVKTCDKILLPELTGLNESQISEMCNQAKSLETHQIVFLIERTSYYIKELKLSANQHLWIEVGIIDLANMVENSSLLELKNRIEILETGANVIPQRVSKSVIKTEVQQSKIIQEKQEKPTNETVVNNTENDFTPPPLSKKSDGNDLATMWQNLLQNIKSTPTQALLKLANPVKIAPDEVIIAFKTENNVAQINETKKQLIINAADALFNQQNSKVVIRIANADDAISVEKKNKTSNDTKKLINNPLNAKAPSENMKEKTTQHNKETEKKPISSDQEKMILDLFDGTLL